MLRALIRKKIKLSNKNFEPCNLIKPGLSMIPPQPLNEASYNNIFPPNPEKKKNIQNNPKQNEKNKGKFKLSNKKQNYLKHNNHIYQMVPPTFIQNYSFEPPFSYAILPNNQFPGFYPNYGIQNIFPSFNNQIQIQMPMNPFDFYHEFEKMKIGTPIIQVENQVKYNEKWSEIEQKKTKSFISQSKYVKRKKKKKKLNFFFYFHRKKSKRANIQKNKQFKHCIF